MSTQVYVDAVGRFLRQEVGNGYSFLGQRTSHAAGRDRPTVTNDKVFLYDRNVVSGEGLFEFDAFLKQKNQAIFVTGIKILVGGSVNWYAYLTDGDESAVSPNALDIDDTDNDLLFDSGAGNAYVVVNKSLPPNAKIRIVTDAVASGTYGAIEVEFFPTLERFERIIN